MAIFRPSAIVGAISGNVGGVNFVASAKGNVARQPRRRTYDHSRAALINRVFFIRASQEWTTLFESTRAAWRTAAKTFPRTNRLGVRTTISGFHLWMKYQLYRNLAPGTSQPIPPKLTQEPGFRITLLHFTAGGPYNVQFANIATTTYTGAQVYGSRPFTTRNVTFFRYKSIDSGFGPAGAIHNMQPKWDIALGAPAAGETVAVELLPTGGDSIPGPRVSAHVTVQAP